MPKKKTEASEPQVEKKSDAKDIEENKVIACLSYVWILFLIPLLLKRESHFTQFHAKQGLILFIVEIIVGLIFWIPVVGQVLGLVTFIVAVIGIYKCLQGEYWKIPYLYQFSKKINL